jgi:hypothetical protein
MKEKVVMFFIFVLAFAFGSVLGHGIGYLLFDKNNKHLCTCEYCKTIRQLEACEVIDSIIKERM